jgi:hypothetical protein
VQDQQVEAVLSALQKQVSQDFAAYWGRDCTLEFLHKNAILPTGWWQMVVTDDADQAGVLGYHEMSSGGMPLGKVFAALDVRLGASWTVTLSHELLEMLVDPWISWCAQSAEGKIYALEVCDPVEADECGYEIDGVLLSDFVTPSWFEPTGAGRMDFKQRVSRRLEVAAGGYLSIFDAAKGWMQISGKNIGKISEGSRTQRRALSRESWKRSRR